MARMAWLGGLAALGLVSSALASGAPDATQAQRYFETMQRQCTADHGKLWGVSLCGPVMFVDPVTRRVVANQADPKGALKSDHGVYVGVLPPDVLIANTSIEWEGVRWIQMLWPVAGDEASRRTLFAHEAFHRIQPQVLPIVAGGDNVQLDTEQGRYTMLLEWRALAAALQASDDADRRARIADALLFRAERYRLFPKAAASENALERNEGVAEYTGVTVGNDTPSTRVAMALKDIRTHADDPSLVRSFAYATGPAYGLLLDRYAPHWRKTLRQGDASLPQLLASALRLPAAQPSAAGIEQHAARYGGAALLSSEQQRAHEHQQLLDRYKAALVNGPVLAIRLLHMHVQFNPNTVLSLGQAGTVYPHLKIIDDWGTLEAERGALLRGDWRLVTVSAPAAQDGTNVHGAGWQLKLKPGWTLVPGPRHGDWTLRQASAAH